MRRFLYVCLLRLDPRHFRQRFADEMLWIFDQTRTPRPLLADGLKSPARQWALRPEPEEQPARVSDGVPTFYTCGSSSPRRFALINGALVTAAVFAALALAIIHSGGRIARGSWGGFGYGFPSYARVQQAPPSSTYDGLNPSLWAEVKEFFAGFVQKQPPAKTPQVADIPLAPPQIGPQPAISKADFQKEKTFALEPSAGNALHSNSGDPLQPKLITAQGPSGVPDSPAQQPTLRSLPSAMRPPMVERSRLDAAERHRVIHAAVANLKEHYTDPGIAQKIADVLLAHEKDGDYETVTDGPVFADLITTQLREVSHDMHLVMVYSQVPLPDRPPGPTPEGVARYRKAMQDENCTFKKVQILRHNTGYLKLNSFPDPAICRPAAMAAMASLNRADAIIFDLRDNLGGYPSMVMLIAAYLFDHPEYMYNPRENTTEHSWTLSPVPGSRLADKPVYVLTSSKTSSGAEHFSYDLKMLRRATLVGETTRGAAHSGVFHRIDDHFGMGIPEVKPINPFSKADWEGTGVEPDIKVKAAQALETAEKLAQSRLRRK